MSTSTVIVPGTNADVPPESTVLVQPTAPDVVQDPGPDDLVLENQVVLILCGLIASGKSTFAEALQQHIPQFRRCNQDDLGDRKQVEALARRSLAGGFSVCIDRTNFNAAQRSYWIEIAREFPGTKIWVIVFDTPYEVCAARLQKRTGHPTITSPEQGLMVLDRFSVDFKKPRPQEGYDRIIYIKPSEHDRPDYTLAEVQSILKRVRDSPSVLPTWAAGRGRGQWRGESTAPQARGQWRGGAPGGSGGGGGRSSNWSAAQTPPFVPRGRGGGNVNSAPPFRWQTNQPYRGGRGGPAAVGLYGSEQPRQTGIQGSWRPGTTGVSPGVGSSVGQADIGRHESGTDTDMQELSRID